MKKIIFVRGIQGSGKTTWAKAWALEDPENRLRISWDDLRNMLGKYWVPNREKIVKLTSIRTLEYAMMEGYDVVIDNMNLSENSIKDFIEAVRHHNGYVEDTPETECSKYLLNTKTSRLHLKSVLKGILKERILLEKK